MSPRAIFLAGIALYAIWGVKTVARKPQEPNQSAKASLLDSAAVDIADEDVPSHRNGPRRALRVPRTQNIFQSVKLTLIVDVDGNVVSAMPQEGPNDVYSQAVAEAKEWKYTPFEKEGKNVVAKITDYVRILPPEDLPKTHQDFPGTQSTAGVVMTLSRSGCYGTCPAYNIEIRGDGTVIYEGKGFVVVTGEHRDHLSPEQVEELVDAFRKADYFSLKDEYRYMVTDCPTYTTSFLDDRVKKSITDYVGEELGMPEAVTELEQTIDRVAGTTKWINGNGETVAALKKEGWDFKSEEAAKTMARGALKGSAEFVQDLLKAGVGGSVEDESGNSALAAAALAGDHKTLQMLIKAGVGKNDVQTKTSALGAAARMGDLEMVRELIGYGGDAKGGSSGERGSWTVLMQAAASGVPEVVELILAAHPDVNASDEKGRTALWYLCDASDFYDKKRQANRGQVIHLLAKAGADLDAQDEEGNTALHGAYNEDVAKALIEDGADVNVRNNDGETPLMRNFSVEAAKLMIGAGADVRAKNHEGKTALDFARQLEPEGERVKFLLSVESAKAGRP
jgi:ankyrin repeat protein